MIFKILFSLVQVLAHLFSSLTTPPIGGGFASQFRAVASLPSPYCSFYLKRSPRLCYGTAFGLCPPCPSLARRSGVFCRLPAGTGSQAKKRPNLYAPPQLPPTLAAFERLTSGAAPQWGAGWGQVCPHLAFACNWGRIAPKPPPQEKKPAEKAAFFSCSKL